MALKKDLKVIEKELHVLYDKGGETNDYVGGYGGGHLQASSYEEIEQHERLSLIHISEPTRPC